MRRLAWLLPLLLAACCRPCPPGPAPVAKGVESPPLPAPAPSPEPPAATEPYAPGALRSLSKEARWARATRDLSLTPEQVRALKDAVVAHDAKLEDKSFIVTRLIERLPLGTVMGDSDEWFSHADPDAMAAAQAELQSRAERVLSPAQFRRWNDLGYSVAFGRRLPIVPREPDLPFILPGPRQY